jgi:aspartate aminotransferase
VPELSSRIVAMPRSGIREIMDLAADRDDVVHLEVGQPDFRTPDHIVEAAARAARDGAHGYTPNKGLRHLREAITGHAQRVTGTDVDPDDIVVSCGAVNALFETLAVLLDPGDALLTPEPGWPNYGMMATLLHAQQVGYAIDVAGDGGPDLDALEATLARTPRAKALLLNTPNNPTGAVYSRATVEAIVELCQRYDVFLVSDECYDQVVFDGEHVSPASIDDTGRVLTVTSVSKSYAMTGWRIGWLLAPDRRLADLVAKVQEPVVACATAVAQHAAHAALSGDQTPVREMVDTYRQRRDVAVPALERHGLALATPRGAIYAVADVSAATRDTYTFARRAVLEHGVAVAPGETFGASGAGTVRLSLATAIDQVELGIERLAAAVAGWEDGR